MQRRRFLAAVGTAALLAGCPSQDVGSDTPTATPVDGTDTPDSDPGDDPSLAPEDLRDRRVVDFENVPLTVALYGRRRINGGVAVSYGISAPATDDSPAVVHALVHNGTGFEQTFALRRLPGFWDPPSADPGTETDPVYLAPTENHDLAETVPDVERDADGRWRLAGAGRDWLPDEATLTPGETLLGEYHLVASEDPSSDPLVVGDYRFNYQGEGFTISVWETDTPGPDEGSDHGGVEVPPLPNSEPTAWFHEADATTEVYLHPSAETVETPDCIEFELVNRSHGELTGNPYRWGLFKLVDGEWFRIAPWGIPVPASTIQPGESRTTELGVFHGESISCADARNVGHLGGGRYAYHGGFGRDRETRAALFDLDAPRVAPEPDDDVTVERDGQEVVVTMPAWNDEDHPPRAELVFERDLGDADRRLIPEQLFRRPMRGFRNALPLFDEGVERVTLRADRHVVGATVDYDDLEQRVAYDGETFSVVGEDPLRN